MKRIWLILITSIILVGISCDRKKTHENKHIGITAHYQVNSIFYKTLTISKALDINNFQDTLAFRVWIGFSNYSPDALLSVQKEGSKWIVRTFDVWYNSLEHKVDSTSLINNKDYSNLGFLLNPLDSIGLFNMKDQNFSEVDECFDRFYDGDNFVFECYKNRHYQHFIFPCPCWCNKIVVNTDIFHKSLKIINKHTKVKLLKALLSSTSRCVDCN